MGSTSQSSMGLLEWMLLIALAMIWGSSYFFNRIALDDLSPLVIVFGRVAIGALVLNLVLRTRGGWLPRDRGLWGRFVVMGAMSQVIPFGLIVWSQTSISGGLAAILNATTPLFTLVAAYLLTRQEPLPANRLAGVLVGILGVAVVIGPAAILDLGGNREKLIAQLAVLTAALSYALASLYGRRFKGMNPLVPAAGQVTGSSLLLLPLLLILNRPWTTQRPEAESIGAVLALAVLCTAVAYVLYFRILASAGASNLSLVTFLLPISALLLSTMILHESIGMRQLAGMGVIFSGLVLVDGRLLARPRWIGRARQARAAATP